MILISKFEFERDTWFYFNFTRCTDCNHISFCFFYISLKRQFDIFFSFSPWMVLLTFCSIRCLFFWMAMSWLALTSSFFEKKIHSKVKTWLFFKFSLSKPKYHEDCHLYCMCDHQFLWSVLRFKKQHFLHLMRKT